jgi:hypothetical protein
MRIDILTIFPEMFDGFINTSIINEDDYYVNFCINGYFFKIRHSDLMGLNLKPLYAYIIHKKSYFFNSL